MKLFEKWKRQWWALKAAELALKYASDQINLEDKFKNELSDIERKLNLKKEVLNDEVRHENIKQTAYLRDLKELHESEKMAIMSNFKNELSLLKSNEFEVIEAKNRFALEKERLLNQTIDLHSSWEEKRELIEGNINEERRFLAEKQALYNSNKEEIDKLNQTLLSKKNKLSNEIFELESAWGLTKEAIEKRIAAEEKILSLKHEEMLDLRDRASSKETELRKLNADLNLQIKTLEAKASPNTIWVTAFSSGFEKAWESMQPLMDENIKNSKKAIEEKAIMDTLSRNQNGHYKKIN